MSPAIRVGGDRGSRPGALEISSRTCAGLRVPASLMAAWEGTWRPSPAGAPTGTGASGGAAALTVRAPLRLPVALPEVTFHVRGSPRCCAQVPWGARAWPAPGRSPAAAPQSRCRRLRPGPTSRRCRRLRHRGHPHRRPAASGAAGTELCPGISPAAGGSLRRSTWWRGPLVRPPRGRGLGGGGAVLRVGGGWSYRAAAGPGRPGPRAALAAVTI